jgi:outer membrane receptor for Fe3+-dicitrate
MTGNYNSGLPVEDADELPDIPFLVDQFGQDVVNKVNFGRGRVRPAASVNASVGIDLLKQEKKTMTLQADVLNIGDRLNVINFAGLLSGTAVSAPRSYGLKLSYQF